MATVTPGAVSARSLVTEGLFERLTQHIVHERGADRRFAERVVDQALAFLAACARNRGQSLVPSPAVDIGWHMFILHTREYAAFCRDIAGGFIHHVPEDDESEAGEDACDLRRTVAAIRAAGYQVDEELWAEAGECGE